MYFLIVLFVLLLVPSYSNAQGWQMEGRSLFVNPNSSLEEIQGLSLANHELNLKGNVPIYSDKSSRVSFIVLVRATSRQLDGPPSAGFVGLSYSPHPIFGIEGGVGIATDKGTLINEDKPFRSKYRLRGAIHAQKSLSNARKFPSFYFYGEAEMGGENHYDNGWNNENDYWWDRKNLMWGRANLGLNLNRFIGVGFLHESSIGSGGRVDIPIQGTPISIYLGLLLAERKMFQSQEVIKKGMHVWVIGMTIVPKK